MHIFVLDSCIKIVQNFGFVARNKARYPLSIFFPSITMPLQCFIALSKPIWNDYVLKLLRNGNKKELCPR